MSCAQMFGSIQRQPLYHPHNYLMPCASTLTHRKRNKNKNERKHGFMRLCLCDLRRIFTSRKKDEGYQL